MKNLHNTTLTITALFLGLIMIPSCGKEEVLTTNSDLNQTVSPDMKARANSSSAKSNNCANNLNMNSSCTFFTGYGHVDDHDQSIENVLNNCHVESLQPGCQWFFQNLTGTKTFVYQYQDPCLGAKEYNNLVQYMVNLATTYRYNSSPNYLITNYDVLVYFAGPGTWKVKVTVDYKRAICKVQNTRK